MTNCQRRLHVANSWYGDGGLAERRRRKIVTIVIGAFAGVAAAEETWRHITEDTTWFVDRIEAPTATHAKRCLELCRTAQL
jgi:hypothetical protein